MDIGNDEYAVFVTNPDRSDWDAMNSERCRMYQNAVGYVRERYASEELPVALIGTVLTFGG